MTSLKNATIATAAPETHVIEYFYAQHCAACREALAGLRRFQSTHEEVYVLEHDVAIYVGLARRYRLASTPATVVDGRRLIYGIPSPEALTAVTEHGTARGRSAGLSQEVA